MVTPISVQVEMAAFMSDRESLPIHMMKLVHSYSDNVLFYEKKARHIIIELVEHNSRAKSLRNSLNVNRYC